jgi:hypothetical protein
MGARHIFIANACCGCSQAGRQLASFSSSMALAPSSPKVAEARGMSRFGGFSTTCARISFVADTLRFVVKLMKVTPEPDRRQRDFAQKIQ